MPFSDRIQHMARAVLSGRLHAADVPVYDRSPVQEVILLWYLEQREPRRAASVREVLDAQRYEPTDD